MKWLYLEKVHLREKRKKEKRKKVKLSWPLSIREAVLH
jgi:hypothetical protein